MEFAEVYETIPGNGWLSRSEAELLWRSVNQTEGPILEVGCYQGRSTCLLAATGRPVYAVDPFSDFSADDPKGSQIYQTFCTNVLGRGFSLAITGADDKDQTAPNGVTLWKQRIEDWTPRPVSFAYLDGDHTYAGTAAQIEMALKCGAKVIGIHDVNDSGGGLEVKRAALHWLSSWSERVERLAVWVIK